MGHFLVCSALLYVRKLKLSVSGKTLRLLSSGGGEGESEETQGSSGNRSRTLGLLISRTDVNKALRIVSKAVRVLTAVDPEL